jgi:hypothetical protein
MKPDTIICLSFALIFRTLFSFYTLRTHSSGRHFSKVEDREGIDARNTLGATAMHKAAWIGHAKVV